MRATAIRLAAVAAAALVACGGGGSARVAGELAPWEVSAGVCAFDDERAYLIALDDGAQCRVVMWRNTVDGSKDPSNSWPSTEYLWK